MPFIVILSASNLWNINPNPAGNTIYGVTKPNANAQATALLSSLSLFIRWINGGIITGINAICTGIKFCDAQARRVKIKSNMNLLFLISNVILFAKTSANPV